MIVVAGHLRLKPGSRESFLQQSLPAVELARTTSGCKDFAVSPDVVDPDRVNIFELWETSEALETFRQDGPSEELSASILSASVEQYEIRSSG